MWYWQRYRNTRSRRRSDRRAATAREALLQVNTRVSSRSRGTAHRLGTVILLLLVLAGGAWLAIAGIQRLGRWLFTENDRYILRTLDLASDGRMQPGHIREYARLETGVNLFALDLDQVRRELESVPVVSQVTVQRVLPDTLRIRVSERIPVARLGEEQAGHPLAVDREGVVLGPSSLSDRLPVITGYRARGLRPGSRAEGADLRTALELLAMCEEPVFNRFLRIRKVDTTGSEEVNIELDRGEKARLPKKNLRPQVERLCQIIQQSADEGRAIASVDLTVERNVPAIYR